MNIGNLSIPKIGKSSRARMPFLLAGQILIYFQGLSIPFGIYTKFPLTSETQKSLLNQTNDSYTQCRRRRLTERQSQLSVSKSVFSI